MARISACESCRIVPCDRGIFVCGRHFEPVLIGEGGLVDGWMGLVVGWGLEG